MQTLKEYYNWGHDKLGDGILATMDEVSFWGEVFTEFMEWDDKAAQRYAEKYREEMAEHLKEAEDAMAAAKA